MFKLKKKTSVVQKKSIPPPKEEEKAPFAVNLRKATTIKREFDKSEMETVDLKHHEFEKVPQEEVVCDLKNFYYLV